MKMNKCFAVVEKSENSDSEMSVIAWGNRSDIIDRHGEKILDTAWKNLDKWMLNPSIVAFHDYTRPIGRAAWAKVVPGKGLKFKVIFSNTEVGKEFYQMYREGTLNAFSVGFSGKYINTEDLPKEKAKEYETGGVIPDRVYTDCELYEISSVTIPANALSLVDRQEKGFFKSTEMNELVEKIKSNPEYIELISKEEKLDHKPDLDLHTDNIDLDKANQINMNKYQEKSEELIDDFKEKQIGDVIEEKLELNNLNIDEKIDLEQKEQIENIEEVKQENLVNELDLIIEEEFKEMGNVREVEEKKEININEKINFYNSLNVKNIKNSDILKKEYGEDFDITKVRTEPANFEYKIFTKYLGCKIKDIFTTDFYIPNAMIGNFLSAFKNVLSKHELIDQRNFYGNGGEIPLQHSVVKLNSKLEEEFLVTGTQFYKSVDGQRFVFQIYKGWSGLGIDIFTTNSEENIELNKSFVKDAVQWVSENNYLKGEKFSISGEFLEVKDMSWDSVIFPSEEAKSKIKKNVEKLSSKSPSRGMMFVGPAGTGKTMTGKVLMNNKDITFIWASSKDFRYGASGALSLGFEMARELAPSVFFLEDIDTWLNGYTVDLLKTEMDGIRENKGVLSILTSNFPEDIPDALIDRPGRFHHIINFSLPDKDNRVKLLKFFTEDADKDIIEKFADLTEGYSGAHLKELVEFAKMIAEDEEITIEDALIKSFEQMKEQKQLIQDLKTGVKKEIEEDIITKSIDFIEVEFPVNKEVELDFDLVKGIFLQNIEKTFGEIDLSDLIDERLKKAKGVIEFED